MKFAIIGCGSIGRRHIANLQSLGHEVAAYNRGVTRREAAKADFGIDVYEDRDTMLREAGAEMIVVCSPNSAHYADASAAIDAGLAVFVEKPLSSSLEHADVLRQAVADKGVFCHVGANMRYHSGPQTVRRLLLEGIIGRPLWAELWGRMYLPDWHPDEDHRQMYSARRDLGGGVLLDFIHEFDLLVWLFGMPQRVAGMTANSGWLEIKTEELADVIFGYEGGFQAHVHVDYLERPAQRGIRVLGDRGSIVWDLAEGAVTVRDLETKEISRYPQPENWEPNEMYLRQWRDVIAAFSTGAEAPSGAEDAHAALMLVEHARHAAAECSMIR